MNSQVYFIQKLGSFHIIIKDYIAIMLFYVTTTKNQNNVAIWLFFLTFLTFLMIIIGGLTRLTESGLSMVDWRPILGIIPPLSNENWLKVFSAYKASPEFIIVNKSMNLDEFKYIFWWEWFHRFFARFIGIVFILPLIFFVVKKAIPKRLFLTLIIIFAFGLFQALVGWWMVKSGLNDNPYVSQYRLTFHLINALIIFAILFWTALNSSNNKIIKFYSSNFSEKIFFFGIILLFITIISGGFMAGTNAGQSFNTFPLMNGSIIPDGYIIDDYGLRNIFENTIAINFNHRWIGSFTFIYILSFTIYLLLSSKIIITIKSISLFAVLFFSSLQFFLGILTLLSNVKISFASLHQSNSVLLLASLLFAYYQFKNNANKPNSL
ncbi:MAG: Heme A synthase [Alphaproteobacteria bacterium MarineAlpha5_Bin3]|jgi:cytochrome c oxidase assembly protein subunit 15|nr:MAG: Heme A synthase [Alphaproteobacteria bacterium MarineAlpha5_Bin3]